MSRAAALVLAICGAFLLPVLAEEEAPPADEEFVKAAGEAYLTAQWLAAYDLAGWWSGDRVLAMPREKIEELAAKLKAWFAYPADDGWHVVYGSLTDDGGGFERILHHLVKDKDEIQDLEDLEPHEFDAPFARALDDAAKRMQASELRRGAAFNPYVRKTAEGVEVWGLPQLTPDWRIVYGLTYCWSYSADGREFKEEKVWSYGLRSTKPDEEKLIQIGTTEFEIPSPGDLYTACRFRDKFFEISVRSKDYISMIGPMGLVNTHLPSPKEPTPDSDPETPKDGDEDRK